MTTQRHTILRQVVELEVRGTTQAQPLQDEISRIYRQRIIPLIDRRCSESSAPDRLHRIESLDLDLGELDPRNLEQDFVEKVDAALQSALAAQIDEIERSATRTGHGSKERSQLELFALFARTGCLPWWADAATPGLLADTLDQLLRESPDALRRLLHDLLREERPRQRISRQYTDAQLAALASLLVPALGPALRRDVRELCELLAKTEMAAGRTPGGIRPVVWESILLAAGPGMEVTSAPEAFQQAVLQRIAIALGSTVADLFAALREASPAGTGSQLERLIGRPADAGTREPRSGAAKPSQLSRRLAHWRPAGGTLSALWAELSGLAARLPAATRRQWLSAIDSAGPGTSLRELARHLLTLLPPAPGEPGSPPVQKIARLAQILRAVRDAEKDWTPDQAGLPTAQAQPAPRRDEAPLDLQFSEGDVLPVDNAGLVILWPFLAHFFDRLGLLDEDRQFRDPAARQRAAGLLQVVATQNPEPAPEYLLPLNKVLCGLGPDQVYDFGAPLTEAEAAECAGLLEAVVAQAPILHDMSPEGFRGSFLLRPGMLSTGEGFWLLRVEPQTYDIVLERFPWTWEWVKLPWMDAPLRVEW
jgi:hypothetical protein